MHTLFVKRGVALLVVGLLVGLAAGTLGGYVAAPRHTVIHTAYKYRYRSVFVAKTGDWTGRFVPVFSCPSTYGVTQRGRPLFATHMTTSLHRELGAQLALYSDQYRSLTPILAPDGWLCVASVGADGNGSITVFPPGTVEPSGVNGSEETVGVVESFAPACQGCIASMACPIFLDAESQHGFSNTYCPTSEPPSESVQFLEGSPTSSFGIAEISDPPGDPGTDALSGGDYPAIGVMDYTPSSGAYEISCVLPESRHILCEAIINRFTLEAEDNFDVTSCGASALPLAAAMWPDNAPVAAREAILRYASNPRISAYQATLGDVVGTLDPCDSHWLAFAVHYPTHGATATGVAHLGVSGWRVTYFGDGYGMEQTTPAMEYQDLFGSLRGG
jgi:hypothetical protein